MKLFALLGSLFAAHISLAGECESLNIAGAEKWAPYYTESGANPDGVSVRVAERAFGTLGIKLHWPKSEIPWKRVLEGLEKGDIDVVSVGYMNEERKKISEFVGPYAEDPIHLWSDKARGLVFDTLQDLKGKRLLKPRGASYGSAFDGFAAANMKVTEGGSTPELFLMLQAQRGDFAIGSSFVGRRAIVQLKQAGKLHIDIEPSKKTVETLGVYMMISKKSPCRFRKDAIDTKFAQLRKTGELGKIQDEYLKGLGL